MKEMLTWIGEININIVISLLISSYDFIYYMNIFQCNTKVDVLNELLLIIRSVMHGYKLTVCAAVRTVPNRSSTFFSGFI
jgi:hypothetical protein